jgi:hypothetical protein
MTQITQTRRRGPALESNRRPGRARAEARHTRMRVSSDSVVSAYIHEIANGWPPATIGLEERVRDPRGASQPKPRRSRVLI